MSAASRAYWRARNLKWITEYLDENELRYEFKSGDWHIRIERALDIYPTRKRYHFLKSGARGFFRDQRELAEVFLQLVQELNKG